ncbi:Thioredoxin reductase [Hondaea fermentalgiana]|uniref:Thioredoxin reductase n=1 Tax=Hondaea fermentalgiana TaxID=2315210 RepID=A0A2R5GT78_9STRA|nr:Thioredoxin reductase [Hondaea fermentalgiana]|eukprot:GBG33529.1 Thioredoxin reductase [Hondaea fermentalgiana]
MATTTSSASYSSKGALARAFVAVLTLTTAILGATGARPLVRNLRTQKEFTRLLNYHRDVTGLGVIIDYYSDGCGPCRQIAPHYKNLAKQYRDKVVFAKVDVNGNRETSSQQRIRSMPTFQFYQNGKKQHQFSGGDLQQLQAWASRLASDFKANNVKITREALESFYKEHAPDKATEENLDKVMKKAGGEEGGKGHRNLAKALKKKYGVAPETTLRYDPDAPQSADDPKQGAKQQQQQTTPPPASSTSSRRAKDEPLKPNLHLASMDALEAELEKRKAELEAQMEENGSEDEDEEDDGEDTPTFNMYTPDPDGLAERVVIIGAGPAGLSAAVYAARAGLRPVVVGPPNDGQLCGKGVLVENYPGLAIDITGPAVVYEMQKQAARYGAVFSDEMVSGVELSATTGQPHVLRLNSSSISTHTVVVATGAASKWLGLESEEKFKGGGVSACATCDGYLYRDQEVVVVGGGDTAMEEALHLATMCSKVTIVHRRDTFSKASLILAQRVMEHPKIEVLWNTTIVDFIGHTETPEEADKDPHMNAQGADTTEDIELLTAVKLRKTDSGEEMTLPVSGAFVAIGHTPNTWPFRGQLTMNDQGYLEVPGPSTRTSVQGVFAAGDVADAVYRQAITSAGTGAMAALDAERWLLEHGIKDERQALEEEMLREIMEETQREREAKLGVDPTEACEESA